MNGAAAIFVKTPGRSPVKTRLAAALGADGAAAFHRAAAEAVAEVVRAASAHVSGYFAIAEPDAEGEWPGLPAVPQGDGDLGCRLDGVYACLIASHPFVVLLGADTPQITPAQLAAAAAWLGDTRVPRLAYGPSEDGGFWLFGSNRSIAGATFRGVRYGGADSGRALLARLPAQAEMLTLPTLHDADRPEDLAPVAAALRALAAPLPRQRALLTLLDALAARACAVAQGRAT